MTKINVGGLPHGSYIVVTDNSAVIAAQQERIAELEEAIHYATDYLDDNKLNSIGHGSKAHNELKDALKEGE